ncbi:MAG: DNA mismatch repair endonuclease MutL [Alphaproteobacteria bacterium]|nr:DNA mismatch repair endonuclease MutL [Alphaproteobacteria bacterium]
MAIRRLPETTVNRIAAGEVIERPAAVVKELVENALDAGACRIAVTVDGGGRTLVAVADDGCGMGRDDLALSIERHATSKLADDDLARIATLGFRGEALPSIGAVARLAIASRAAGSADGWRMTVEGGVPSGPRPTAHAPGTRVEVRDLFFATPARLKFLKTERTELERAREAIERLALAHPEVGFTLTADGRPMLRLDPPQGDLFDARRARVGAVVGRGFGDNSVPIAFERGGVGLTGQVGLPTYSRTTSEGQHVVVNGRPVRDRQLLSAIRGAYQDLLPRDRHPVVALFLELDPAEVDVNVHPTKAEVRFRDPSLVRSIIVVGVRSALDRAGHRTATHGAAAVIAGAIPGSLPYRGAASWVPRGMAEAAASYHAPLAPGFAQPTGRVEVANGNPGDHPLGAARAQLHATYIVAQTADGLVIVDQHAAHERLVYERVKAAMAEGGVGRQTLLLPEVVELEPAAVERLVGRAAELAELGLVIEGFGPGAVVVRETPAPLGATDAAGLVRDVADDLAEIDEAASLKDRLAGVCATMACHGSVRAGRTLSAEEMNALLREMESTPNSGSCGHGRPTYVELKLHDIERLFGRR